MHIDENKEMILQAIGDERYKVLCINNTSNPVDFEAVKEQIVAAYERKLPTKSIFEM